ncbi:vicilin-like seed storage protein At2g18540, partial [Pseudomyrmex gracilis]|uniref:vicilin-like seed storage protein At2g18540 n=1 Tax=Pseudomyrmex gracilis TaxID=219809 RepID=UPI000995DEDF
MESDTTLKFENYWNANICDAEFVGADEVKELEESDEHEEEDTCTPEGEIVKSLSQLYKWDLSLQKGGTHRQKLLDISQYVLEKFKDANNNNRIIHDLDLRRWALGAKKQINLPHFKAGATWIGMRQRRITLLMWLDRVREGEICAVNTGSKIDSEWHRGIIIKDLGDGVVLVSLRDWGQEREQKALEWWEREQCAEKKRQERSRQEERERRKKKRREEQERREKEIRDDYKWTCNEGTKTAERERRERAEREKQEQERREQLQREKQAQERRIRAEQERNEKAAQERQRKERKKQERREQERKETQNRERMAQEQRAREEQAQRELEERKERKHREKERREERERRERQARERQKRENRIREQREREKRAELAQQERERREKERREQEQREEQARLDRIRMMAPR